MAETLDEDNLSVKNLLKFALWSMLIGSAAAHHGGSSLSQGAGTPIETNSPLSLPQGSTIVFTRAELVSFRKFAKDEPNNTDSFNFFQIGASYGLTDALSVTAIVPFNEKNQDNHGSFRGIGDVKVLFNLGMNYSSEDGVQLNGPDDVAVNLAESPKTYFGLYGGLSVPTGQTDKDFGLGIDRGLQPGFGSMTYTVGASVTKALSPSFTLAGDVGFDFFTTHNGDKFGDEFRANLAGVYRLHSDDEGFIKQLDGVLELNYLQLGRDSTGGVADLGTGGKILYLSPGARFQVGDFNFGALVKFPVSTGLNERYLQQGAEGLENYRLIFTASTFF